PQNEWMMHGEIEKTRDYYRAILDTRENVLRVFQNIAARNKNNRQYFLAKTAYFFFSPVASDTPAQMRAFAEDWRKCRLLLRTGANSARNSRTTSIRMTRWTNRRRNRSRHLYSTFS
ncbi:MAG: hypothetical protein J6W70_00200, partial [Lentisphaeria bacterium]|nr:hypothetical protein [Lentisphaeria bacterium]